MPPRPSSRSMVYAAPRDACCSTRESGIRTSMNRRRGGSWGFGRRYVSILDPVRSLWICDGPLGEQRGILGIARQRRDVQERTRAPPNEARAAARARTLRGAEPRVARSSSPVLDGDDRQIALAVPALPLD